MPMLGESVVNAHPPTLAFLLVIERRNPVQQDPHLLVSSIHHSTPPPPRVADFGARVVCVMKCGLPKPPELGRVWASLILTGPSRVSVTKEDKCCIGHFVA